MVRTVGSASVVSWPQRGQYASVATAPQLRQVRVSGLGMVVAGVASVMPCGGGSGDQLIDARENAAQNVDFRLFKSGTGEQPAQARHETPGPLGIQETHGGEGALGVRIKRLDFVDGRRFESRCVPHAAAF